MPETAYVQQAILVKTQKQQQTVVYQQSSTEMFICKMKQKMQKHIYDSTRSNLGF